MLKFMTTCVGLIHHYVDLAINAVLDVNYENVSQDSAILRCYLAFSPELQCVLFNITTNNTNVLPMNSTSNVSGSDKSCNYPTQLITLNNLTSGAIYSYCVVAINTTDMNKKVGNPMCGNFYTNDSTDDNESTYLKHTMCNMNCQNE